MFFYIGLDGTVELALKVVFETCGGGLVHLIGAFGREGVVLLACPDLWIWSLIFWNDDVAGRVC